MFGNFLVELLFVDRSCVTRHLGPDIGHFVTVCDLLPASLLRQSIEILHKIDVIKLKFENLNFTDMDPAVSYQAFSKSYGSHAPVFTYANLLLSIRLNEINGPENMIRVLLLRINILVLWQIYFFIKCFSPTLVASMLFVEPSLASSNFINSFKHNSRRQ